MQGKLNESKGVREKIHSILEQFDGNPSSSFRRRNSSRRQSSRPKKSSKKSRKNAVEIKRSSKIQENIEGSFHREGSSKTDLVNTMREGRHCIESLKDVVVEKKRDLENVTGELKLAQSQIAELFENALTRINMLKKHLRTLTNFAEDLSRLGRQRDESAELLHTTIREIDDSRRGVLEKINDPRWEVKHHFHIFSLEHWRGNLQPNLIDIAEVLPGRLLLVAFAKCNYEKQEETRLQFRILNRERDALWEKLRRVEEHRQLTQGHLMDYHHMLSVMKNSMNPQQIKECEKAIEKNFAPDVREVTNNTKRKTRDEIRRNFINNLPNMKNHSLQKRRKQNKEDDLDEIIANVNRTLGLNDEIGHITGTNTTVNSVEENGDKKIDNPILDEPHHDWSTLRNILNILTHSSIRRKEVSIELEDVMKCREGLKTDLLLLRDAYGKQISNDKNNDETVI